MTLRRLAFVVSSRANLFMAEILQAYAREAREAGLEAALYTDGFPALQDGLAYVVVPHEFFDTTAVDQWPSDDQLRRTVALTTEQPGTPWFDRGAQHARRCGAAGDLSPVGVDALRHSGVAAIHVPFGYVPSWDLWGGDDAAERPVDVLFLGSLNRRRDELLATYASTLWRRRSELIITTHEPKVAPGPDFLVGDEKRRRIANAKVLLAPGRQAAPYFESVRAVEAIANGCVLVCDHAKGFAPLVPGQHYLSGAAENLALLADHLLRAPEHLDAVRRAAYDALRTEAPLATGAQRLIDLADGLLAQPASSTVPPAPDPPPPAPPEPAPDPALAALKRVMIESIGLRRRVAVLEERIAGGSEDPHAPFVVHRTPAWEATDARVTVCVPCFNHEREVVEAIESVAVQDFAAIELVVLDDGSDDRSRDVVVRALEARPWLPATLLGMRVNGGLPRARNHMVRVARGEYVLMLDADNALYPPAVSRLVEALDGDPGALFAYPALEAHVDGRSVALLSYRAWDPRLLARHNIVDALALLRREALLGLGGYTQDLRMYGWEDYDLWVRAAERGHHGVHVAEILGRYRRGASSMLSITDIDTATMLALLAETYPRTMAASRA